MKTESVVGAVLGAIVRVIAVIFVIYLIYHGAIKCYDYGYRVFTEPAVSQGSGREVTVMVTKDMSAFDIGKLFEEKGLTRDAKLFALQYLLSEYKNDVAPGTYVLNTAMTAEEMMEAMVPDSTGTEEDTK